MMLATPFTKGLRDRWLGITIAALSIGLTFWAGGTVYRNLGDDVAAFITGMPDAVVTMFGFVDGVGTVGIILGEMINFMAPLAIAGVAISMGSAAVAGEERLGVFELLLSNPRTRTRVVAEKLAAVLLLVAVGGGVLYGGVVAVGAGLGSDYSNIHPLAAVTHVTALGWFFGMFTFAVGAWTGRASVASGAGAGMLITAWLAASLLPMVEPIADLARLSPWHYLSSSAPLVNGTDWGHVGILCGLAAACAAAALVGVNRRDLRSGWTGTNLRERLSGHPRVGALVERLSGDGALIGSVFTKTIGDGRLMTTVTAIILGYLGVLMGLLYNSMDDLLVQFAGALPEAMLKIFGIADIATLHGFLNAELFVITGPIAVIYVATALASRGIAGEQDRGVMDALLANPVRRSSIVFARAGAIAILVLVLAVVLGGTAWLGTLMLGLNLEFPGVVGVILHLTAFGWVFGGLALLVAALAGRGRLAVAVTSGVALVTYAINGFLTVSESLVGWTKLTPWYYHQAANPLENGVDVGHVGVLVAVAVLLVGFAAAAFERVDVR